MLLRMHVIYGIIILISLFSDSVWSELCDQGTGECKQLSARDCPVIFFNLHLLVNEIKYCNEFEDIVCCPLPLHKQYQAPVDETRPFEQQCKSFNEIRPSCQTTPFIWGGTKAEPREFPFMALIGNLDRDTKKISWDCGGTLIHPKFVVTAAHCLETNEKKAQRLDPNFDSQKFVVRLGELDYSTDKDDAKPQNFQVVNYVLHPNYDDDEQGNNDIAIIELDRNATVNEYVAPACLPPSEGKEYKQFTAAGWGLTETYRKSSHLLKVGLERFSDDLCDERLELAIERRSQFCAGSVDSDKDTCNGDSGGPIFVQHTRYNCLKILVGLTSFGRFCGTKGVPSVYTKVHLYTDWIENIVWGQ